MPLQLLLPAGEQTDVKQTRMNSLEHFPFCKKQEKQTVTRFPPPPFTVYSGKESTGLCIALMLVLVL